MNHIVALSNLAAICAPSIMTLHQRSVQNVAGAKLKAWLWSLLPYFCPLTAQQWVAKSGMAS